MRQFYTGVGNTEGRLRTRRWLVLDDDLWPRTLESETRPCLGTRGPRLSPEARAPFSFSSLFFPPLPPFSSLCPPTSPPSPPPSHPLLPHHIFRLPLPLLFPSIPSVSVGLSIVISRDWPVSCRAKRSPMETPRWSRRAISGGQGDARFASSSPFLSSFLLFFSLFFFSIEIYSSIRDPLLHGTTDERFLGVIRFLVWYLRGDWNISIGYGFVTDRIFDSRRSLQRKISIRHDGEFLTKGWARGGGLKIEEDSIELCLCLK